VLRPTNTNASSSAGTHAALDTAEEAAILRATVRRHGRATCEGSANHGRRWAYRDRAVERALPLATAAMPLALAIGTAAMLRRRVTRSTSTRL
jgi:hypothetical protein